MEDPFLGQANLIASRLATDRFRYPDSAPYCIYCGSREQDRGREHIYPAGLSGKLELLKASCDNCSTETCKVEQRILRGQFWLARRRAGIQSGRDKRGQPEAFPFVHIFPEGKRSIDVPLDAAPAIGILILLQWPFSMPGPVPPKAGRESLKRFFWFCFDEQAQILDEVAKISVMGEVEIGRVMPRHYIARLAAKVSHSFAVSEMGVEAFRPYLYSIIMNDDEHAYKEFIGQYPITLDEPRGQLSLYTMNNGATTLVLVRANLWPRGTPPYLAVVGELWR